MENRFIYVDQDNKILGKYVGNEETVEIPDGVEIIGDAAFASCYSLKNIIFPNSLKSISHLAFYNCINLEINIDNLSCEKAEDAFIGCAKLKKKEFVLKEMTIAEIESSLLSSFYVKDYQRGYRWTKNEIEELLDDIWETTRRYCLQPLIVKQSIVETCGQILDKVGLNRQLDGGKFNNKPAYELVDGQQRLTTLLLILNECSIRTQNPVLAPAYTIYYELCRAIDEYYIDQAKEVIKNWFENNSYISKEVFAEKIRKSLFFIWYEMKSDGTISVEKEFRNINDGQTPLTNSELFKAMLLNPENAEASNEVLKEDIYARLVKIAYEWDTLEQALHDEEFWLFIANKECREQTRLDYLFELYAVRLTYRTPGKGRNGDPLQKFNAFSNKLKELDRERERFSFLVIKEYIDYLCEINKNGRFVNIVMVWEEIVRQYHRLYSWFSNSELYHNIGYLVAVEKQSSGNSIVPEIIIELFKDGFAESFSDITSTQTSAVKSLSELKKHIKDNIKKYLGKQLIAEKKESITVFSDQYYNRGNHDVRDFLLYVNVWSTAQAGEKFPFYKFKNTKDQKGQIIAWDIEHISAKNLKTKISPEELERIRPWWREEEKTMGYDVDSAERRWDKDEWDKFAKKINGEEPPDNSVSNLVLLDRNTNRSYGDALFFGKRREIIERDKNNTYIPICTKNVFLKYYTDDPNTSLAWTERDKHGYMNVILQCIKEGIYQNEVPQVISDKIEEERQKAEVDEK